MIKANELRIGNLVNKDNKLCRIYGIEEGNRMERFEGIPLTDYWFEKCGFEYIQGRWELNGVRIGDFSGWDGSGSEYRLDDMDAWIGYKAPEIKYVHQLQNLFYCLTGQELEVRL